VGVAASFSVLWYFRNVVSCILYGAFRAY